jgi:hypothetical protein
MNISLSHYHIQRPEKVRWFFPQVDDVLTALVSHSLVESLQDVDKYLTEQQITWKYTSLSREAYAEWLKYYRTKMTENEFLIIADEEWYERKMTEEKTVEGIFFYQQEQIVGSGIFVRQGNEKSIFAFKASDKIKFSNSKVMLGAIIDYFFLKIMTEQKVKVISGGRSKNIFGVHNSFGYLSYMLRFGFYAEAAEDTTVLDDVELNSEGCALFYGLQNGEFKLFGIKKKGDPTEFEPGALEKKHPFEVIEYDQP